MNLSSTSHIQRARTTALLDFRIKPLGPNLAVFLHEKSPWFSVHHHVQYPRQAIKSTKQFKTKEQVIKLQYTFEIQAKYLLLQLSHLAKIFVISEAEFFSSTLNSIYKAVPLVSSWHHNNKCSNTLGIQNRTITNMQAQNTKKLRIAPGGSKKYILVLQI